MGNFWDDFTNATLQKLGVDTGSNAAATVASAIGQAKNSSGSAPAVSTVSAATPAMPTSKLIFGMKPQTAAAVGIGLALVVYLAMRRK